MGKIIFPFTFRLFHGLMHSKKALERLRPGATFQIIYSASIKKSWLIIIYFANSVPFGKLLKNSKLTLNSGFSLLI